jgi:hypothetical protein
VASMISNADISNLPIWDGLRCSTEKIPKVPRGFSLESTLAFEDVYEVLRRKQKWWLAEHMDRFQH